MQAPDRQVAPADQTQPGPSHNTQSTPPPTTDEESPSSNFFVAPNLNSSQRQETFRSVESRRTFNPVPRRPAQQQLFDEHEPWRPKNVLTLGELSLYALCLKLSKCSRWWGNQRLLQPTHSKTSYDHGQDMRAKFYEWERCGISG